MNHDTIEKASGLLESMSPMLRCPQYIRNHRNMEIISRFYTKDNFSLNLTFYHIKMPPQSANRLAEFYIAEQKKSPKNFTFSGDHSGFSLFPLFQKLKISSVLKLSCIAIEFLL